MNILFVPDFKTTSDCRENATNLRNNLCSKLQCSAGICWAINFKLAIDNLRLDEKRTEPLLNLIIVLKQPFVPAEILKKVLFGIAQESIRWIRLLTSLGIIFDFGQSSMVGLDIPMAYRHLYVLRLLLHLLTLLGFDSIIDFLHPGLISFIHILIIIFVCFHFLN